MNPLGLCPNKGQSPRVPGRRILPPRRRHRSGPLRSPPVGGPHLSTKSKHKGDVALCLRSKFYIHIPYSRCPGQRRELCWNLV
jgi:hypothetical protein